MGVDSGLPDFRGGKGFWRAYPAYAKRGLRFEQMADPVHFDEEPELAWGFYGHRLNLYRAVVPHKGFGILKRWRRRFKSHFVLTSNVDGQFQKAGFSRVFEIHGSIHELQCTRPCHGGSWSANELVVHVDETTMRASSPLPRCPHCHALARPRVLMFGDGRYVNGSALGQEIRFHDWIESMGEQSVVVVELGAGTGLPTIRRMGEAYARSRNACLIRINPRESDVGSGHVGIALAAADALVRLERAMV